MEQILTSEELKNFGINLDVLDSEESLQHWGIQGMKWGVRRYQNADGSLTAAGRKRYNQEVEALKAEKAKLEQKQKNLNAQKRMQARTDKLKSEIDELKGKKKKTSEAESQESVEKRDGRKLRVFKGKDKPKKPEEMTAEELQAEIDKMRNLKTYKQLYSELNPPEVKQGKEAVQKFWKEGVLPAVTEATKSVGKDYLTKVGKDLLGLSEKNELEKLKAAYDKVKYKKDTADLEKALKELSDKELQESNRNAKMAKNQQEVNKAKNGKSTEDVLKDFLNKSKDKYTQEEINKFKEYIEDGTLWDVLKDTM